MEGQSNIGTILSIIFFLSIFALLIFFALQIYDNEQVYNSYKNFCKERPNFCYCSLGSCEYKIRTTQSCINGVCSNEILSPDTLALCNLIKYLNDTKMQFKVGCS